MEDMGASWKAAVCDHVRQVHRGARPGYLRKMPTKRLRTNKIKKMKNSIFAMPIALVAMPPNPKMAATIATTKNIAAQLSINYLCNQRLRMEITGSSEEEPPYCTCVA
jgi:hypothetical protein